MYYLKCKCAGTIFRAAAMSFAQQHGANLIPARIPLNIKAKILKHLNPS